MYIMFAVLLKFSIYIFCVWLPCVRMAWVCDGSEGFSINGSTVTHIDPSDHDNVYNCMWVEDYGVSSGRHYWKIRFDTLESRGGVCLTSKECFKKGYDTKGLCYHGNLSDNSIFLVGKFGPQPVEGDTIGILASFESDRLKVYLDVNGKSLGLAFDVPASIFSPTFVAVHFHESGSATCEKEIELPSNNWRDPTIFTGIEGDWKLEVLVDHGVHSSISSLSLFEYPTSHFEKIIGENNEEDLYKWYVRGLPDKIISYLSKHNGKWKTSNIRFSLKDSPNSQTKFKHEISDLMEMVERVNVERDGSLHVESDNISTIWTRYDEMLKPFILDVLPSKYARCKIY